MYDEQTRTTWIQEFTTYASEGIQNGLRAFGSLRGHLITFKRLRPSDTSPLAAYVGQTQTPDSRLPPEIDLVPHLYKIWNYNHKTTKLRTAQDK